MTECMAVCTMKKKRNKINTHTFNGLSPQPRIQKHAKNLFAREKMPLFAGCVVRTHYVDRSILREIIVSYVNYNFRWVCYVDRGIIRVSPCVCECVCVWYCVCVCVCVREREREREWIVCCFDVYTSLQTKQTLHTRTNWRKHDNREHILSLTCLATPEKTRPNATKRPCQKKTSKSVPQLQKQFSRVSATVLIDYLKRH